MITGKFVLLIFASITGFLGIILLVVIVIMKKVEKQKQIKCQQKVEATIVDVVRDSTLNYEAGDLIIWYPIYEYQFQGETLREQSSLGNKKENYQIGTKVELYIDPSNPTNIYTKDKEALSKITTIFIIASSILLILSTIFFLCFSKFK